MAFYIGIRDRGSEEEANVSEIMMSSIHLIKTESKRNRQEISLKVTLHQSDIREMSVFLLSKLLFSDSTGL